MTDDGRGKAAPGEGEFSPGPCVPRYRGIGGTPLTSHSKAKGRRTGRYRAPFSFLKVPTARKEKISNGDNKIAAWLGRETRMVVDTKRSRRSPTKEIP